MEWAALMGLLPQGRPSVPGPDRPYRPFSGPFLKAFPENLRSQRRLCRYCLMYRLHRFSEFTALGRERLCSVEALSWNDRGTESVWLATC